MIKQKLEGRIMGSIVVFVFAVIFFAAIAPVQAQPYAVYGQVFDTDGTTTVDGVSVTVTCLETTESLSTTTPIGGWYSVTLGNPPYSVTLGDTLRIVADAGDGRTNTTEVEATGAPQHVDLILQVPQPAAVPLLEPPALIALAAILGILAMTAIIKKKGKQ